MRRTLESQYRASAFVSRAIALSAVLAVGLGAAPPALAQRITDGDQTAARRTYHTQIAVFNGYRAGFERGTGDSGSGARFAPKQGTMFREATHGHTLDLGPAGRYQRVFRGAYTRGYSDAFNGRGLDPASSIAPLVVHPPSTLLSWYFGNVPRVDDPGSTGGDLLSVAGTHGYTAGYTQGIEDRKRGETFEYRRHETYLTASRGYDRRIGDRSRYQSVFRQVYSRGYSDGFNGRPHYSEFGPIPVSP
jgi:hypothetical protein